ncbi:unnamed protein product [Discosporangium mesarthrocarpum]
MEGTKRAGASRMHILDRQIVASGRGGKPAEVSLSAFSFLFSEMVQYMQNRVTSIADLERKLEEAGYGMGLRVLELLTFRERQQKRKIRLLPVLQWVSSNVWKALFGKTADSLERSTENEDEYMIHEREPITNTFVSVPPDLGQLNCAALVAGVIAGVLDGASFVSNPPLELQICGALHMLKSIDQGIKWREGSLFLQLLVVCVPSVCSYRTKPVIYGGKRHLFYHPEIAWSGC